MKRPWQIWMSCLLCLAIVLPAMGWLTLKALELDRAQTMARRQAERGRNEAEVQELVSSALWRMDWTLTPLVAQEAARPYYVYESFYTAAGADQGENQVPSPLLIQPSEYVLLHFQLTPDGTWSSPQRPTGLFCQIAIDAGAPAENIQTSADRLHSLQQQTKHAELLSILPSEMLPAIEISNLPWAGNLSLNYDGTKLAVPSDSVTNDLGIAQLKQPQQIEQLPVDQFQVDFSHQQQVIDSPQPHEPDKVSLETQGAAANRRSAQASVEISRRQQLLRGYEWQFRNRAYEAFAKNQLVQQRANTAPIMLPKQLVREGVSRPVWVGDHLLLARRVVRNGQVLIQGCWLNWPRIKTMLLEEIADLLPEVDLMAVTPESRVHPSRTLATLPVQIVLPDPTLTTSELSAGVDGSGAGEGRSSLSPIQLSLLIAWGCLMLAAAAVAGLLLGVLTLSERRGAFVSAVTHELRTPLTTFRMYAEMLAAGMVPDAQQRQNYLETLRTEADRLAHLVENVLAYARLERGGTGRNRQRVTVRGILEQVHTRLSDRALQANMELVVEADENAGCTALETDPAAVEQVLFNLVDNACKYAVLAADRRIHLHVDAKEKSIQFSVRDHGQGIALRETKRLFRPFSKSVQQAAASGPGVGLGLALCRRLARSLRGRLELQSPKEGGVTFVLTLPKTL